MHPIERIQRLSKYNPDNGCWEWIGALKGRRKLEQYGHLTVGSRRDGSRRVMAAHRYSYLVFIGFIPDDKFVCHSCDNPLCVNPKHLFLGTRQENVDDRERKGRNVIIFGENHPNAKLTEADVLKIRTMKAQGVKRRFIVRETGIETKLVKDIIRGRNWKHILPSPPKTSDK